MGTYSESERWTLLFTPSKTISVLNYEGVFFAIFKLFYSVLLQQSTRRQVI